MRLDVPFHRPSLVRYIQRIDAHPAGIEPIRNLAIKVVDGPFGTQLKADEYVDSGIPLIRVSDVRTGKISRDGLVYITPEKQDALCRSRVLPNDVVLTKAGAILGYAAVFPDSLVEGNITSHSVLIRCQDRILPQFLAYFLRSAPGQRQVYRWGNKATRPELNTQEVKRIHVPLLSIDKQREIIAIMSEGERRSETFLADAMRLLSSIDDYLLAELGITLPPEPEKTITNRTFLAQRHALAGWRFDPQFHKPWFVMVNEALNSCHYRKPRIRDLCHLPVGGATPTRGDDSLYAQEGVKFIRIMNVGKDELVLNDVKYINKFVHEKDLFRSQLSENDILMTITGRVGTAAVVTQDILPANINQHIVRLRLRVSDCYPDYLSLYLNCSLGTILSNRPVTGGTRIALDYPTISALQVPLPPRDVQRKILGRVGELRAEAKRFRQQAEVEIEVAKRRIEAMLLGETA